MFHDQVSETASSARAKNPSPARKLNSYKHYTICSCIKFDVFCHLKMLTNKKELSKRELTIDLCHGGGVCS